MIVISKIKGTVTDDEVLDDSYNTARGMSFLIFHLKPSSPFVSALPAPTGITKYSKEKRARDF